MTEKTMNKILIAIAYLSLHGISINKQRISNYTGLSWITVSKYYDEIYSLFLLSDIDNFKSNYKGGIK